MNTILEPVPLAHHLSLYMHTITRHTHTGPGHWEWSHEAMTKGLQE